MKRDVHIIDDELLGATDLRDHRDVNVDDHSASAAYRMVVLRHVRVETSGARTDFDRPNFADLGQIVKRLIHGFQRDHRHVPTRRHKDRLCRGMKRGGADDSQDEFSLRRDLHAVGTKPTGGVTGPTNGFEG